VILEDLPLREKISAKPFLITALVIMKNLGINQVIVVIFYKFTFVEFLVRQKIACHERIHLKFTKRNFKKTESVLFWNPS
jgi:hypothetical protein